MVHSKMSELQLVHVMPLIHYMISLSLATCQKLAAKHKVVLTKKFEVSSSFLFFLKLHKQSLKN